MLERIQAWMRDYKEVDVDLIISTKDKDLAIQEIEHINRSITQFSSSVMKIILFMIGGVFLVASFGIEKGSEVVSKHPFGGTFAILFLCVLLFLLINSARGVANARAELNERKKKLLEFIKGSAKKAPAKRTFVKKTSAAKPATKKPTEG